MALVHERVFLGSALLEILLTEDRHYRLKYGDLVEYADGVRLVRGRRQPYEFRSVEQLRYDFERDVVAAGGKLG